MWALKPVSPGFRCWLCVGACRSQGSCLMVLPHSYCGNKVGGRYWAVPCTLCTGPQPTVLVFPRASSWAQFLCVSISRAFWTLHRPF